jgi:hypothetical protein
MNAARLQICRRAPDDVFGSLTNEGDRPTLQIQIVAGSHRQLFYAFSKEPAKSFCGFSAEVVFGRARFQPALPLAQDTNM